MPTAPPFNKQSLNPMRRQFENIVSRPIKTKNTSMCGGSCEEDSSILAVVIVHRVLFTRAPLGGDNDTMGLVPRSSDILIALHYISGTNKHTRRELYHPLPPLACTAVYNVHHLVRRLVCKRV